MTDTATVVKAAVPVIADETVESIVTDELVRSLAMKLNPYVKVGRERAGDQPEAAGLPG